MAFEFLLVIVFTPSLAHSDVFTSVGEFWSLPCIFEFRVILNTACCLFRSHDRAVVHRDYLVWRTTSELRRTNSPRSNSKTGWCVVRVLGHSPPTVCRIVADRSCCVDVDGDKTLSLHPDGQTNWRFSLRQPPVTPRVSWGTQSTPSSSFADLPPSGRSWSTLFSQTPLMVHRDKVGYFGFWVLTSSCLSVCLPPSSLPFQLFSLTSRFKGSTSPLMKTRAVLPRFWRGCWTPTPSPPDRSQVRTGRISAWFHI